MNRFSQWQPIASNYLPKEYTPDFNSLIQALQQQQGQYDQLLEANSQLPQYMKEDEETALRIKERNAQREQEMVEAYKQGIDQGNSKRRDILYDIKEDWQQGGLSYGLQTNKQKYDEYEQLLDQLVATGTITPMKAQAARAHSTKDFRSFDDKDSWTEFNGYDTVPDLDLVGVIGQALEGWEPDYILGREVTSLHDGQLVYVEDQEIVDADDIRAAALAYAKSNPKVGAYLQQQDELFDQFDPNMSNSEFELNNAADFLASKMSKLKSTRQIIDPWKRKMEYQDFLARKRKKDEDAEARMFQGHRAGGAYNTGLNLRPIPPTTHRDRNIEALTIRRNSILKGNENSIAMAVVTGEETSNKTVQRELDLIDEQLEDLRNMPENLNAKSTIEWYRGAEGRETYPHMAYALETLQRRDNIQREAGFAGEMAGRIGFGTQESDTEFLERARQYASALGDELNQAHTVYQDLSAKGLDELRKSYIDNLDILNQPVTLVEASTGVNSPMKFTKAVAQLGVDVEDDKALSDWVKNNVSIGGRVTPGSAAHFDPEKGVSSLPLGTEITVRVDGTDYNMIVNDASIQQTEAAARLQSFALAKHAPHLVQSSLGKGFSEPIQVAGGMIVAARARVVPDDINNPTRVTSEPEIWALNPETGKFEHYPKMKFDQVLIDYQNSDIYNRYQLQDKPYN